MRNLEIRVAANDLTVSKDAGIRFRGIRREKAEKEEAGEALRRLAGFAAFSCSRARN